MCASEYLLIYGIRKFDLEKHFQRMLTKSVCATKTISWLEIDKCKINRSLYKSNKISFFVRN